MGCSQSNQGVDPSQKKVSAPLQHSDRPSVQHSPQDFQITMIGNTSTHGMILGFQPNNFIPIPSRTPIPLFCHAILLNTNTGYITGGVEDLQANSNTKATIDHQIVQGNISKRFIKVDMVKLLRQPEQSFQMMPDMINARYAHVSILMKGSLYVLGGRQYGQDEKGLLSACQKYDQATKKWKAIPSMQYSRAAASAVLYGEFIYVFGGYTGGNTRAKSIQTYSQGDSSWRKLPYELHEGFQGAYICKRPGSQCSILIFGGKTNLSKSNRVVQLNFDKATVSTYPPMKQERSFHKGALVNGQVFLVGGGCELTEVYQIAQQKSQLNKELSYLEYCSMKEMNSFSQFTQQVNLEYHKRKQNLPIFPNRICIFGHAFQPFAKLINTDNMIVVSQGQNLTHRFYQFTNVVKVNKQYCFVLGGISSDLTQVTNCVYSFNLLNNQVKSLNPMTNSRYAFASTVLGSYLYVMGGRKLGDDDVAILGQCQRFSFQTYEWETIASLQYKRQSAIAVTIGDYVLCIGGYKGNNTKSNQIQMYIPQQNRWVQLAKPFDLSVQSMTPVKFNNSVYLFGGRSDTDVQKVFKLKIELDQGVKYQRSVKTQLQPVGSMNNPGTNLKVFVDTNGKAYILGNVPKGIDVFDLNKLRPGQAQQLKIFQQLSDPLFQSYTIIF